MNVKCPVLAALAGALTILIQTTSAQTWQTVDDYQYVAGQAAVNLGLTVAPSGVLYASGYGGDGSTWHGLVMASRDGGNTWSEPLDDFVYPGSATREDGIVADAAGNLYVAGLYYFSNGNFHRFVRRSADGGATWQTVDDFALGSSASFLTTGNRISADTAGNIYAAEMPGIGFSSWIIRKGIGGTNYSTVDVFNGLIQAVFAHPTAGVFAVGDASLSTKTGTSSAWLVRRSLDGGATWATVDTYQASSGYQAEAFGVGADARGNLYVVGRAALPNKRSSINHWQVRKSNDGGASWSTVDDYALFTAGDQLAVGLVSDSNGNLFVAGWASASTGFGPYYWLVRESLGGTGPWTTVENFSYVSGASPHAIAADALGNVFAGGQGSPASGAVHWLVRRN